MSKNWTKGPWVRSEPDTFGDFTITPAEGGFAIAAITNGEFMRMGGLAHEHKANADLVTAAPELYDACAALVAEKVDYMDLNNLGNPEEQHTIIWARAAMAKARGDQ